jgi:hypothetical protein
MLADSVEETDAEAVKWEDGSDPANRVEPEEDTCPDTALVRGGGALAFATPETTVGDTAELALGTLSL